VARWFSRTGARETGSSEEGGPRQAVVTGTEELTATTHWKQRCDGRRDAREDSFYSCAAREGDGSSRRARAGRRTRAVGQSGAVCGSVAWTRLRRCSHALARQCWPRCCAGHPRSGKARGVRAQHGEAMRREGKGQAVA
jgi:hypothetical protein